MKPFISNWDWNPAKTHGLVFVTKITDLFSGPNETQVLGISLHKVFSERQSDR